MMKNLLFITLILVVSIAMADSLAHSGQAVTDFSGK
jgi:hypothetical protein